MKRAALSLSAAVMIAGWIVLAQGADDPMAELRGCSLMEHADRLECLNKLSLAAAPPARPGPGAVGWIISRTTSPVDYTPIATATTLALDSGMQLSIRCRGGRAELALAGSGISGSGEDYVVSYRVNGGAPLQVPAVPASSASLVLKADAAALLQSLPSDGELAVHLSPRVGVAKDTIFSLVGLEVVRAKIAAACKWPHTIAKPNN
jgi:hypothetical protein